MCVFVELRMSMLVVVELRFGVGGLRGTWGEGTLEDLMRFGLGRLLNGRLGSMAGGEGYKVSGDRKEES